jgi:hypothetical protein
LQLFGRKIASAVEILTVACPAKWKTVFVGTETDATTIASTLIAAIKNHLANSLENEARSVQQTYNASHPLFLSGGYIRVSQLAAWQVRVQDQRHHFDTMASLLQNPFSASLPSFYQWKTLAANAGDVLSSGCQRRREPCVTTGIESW